MKESVGCLRFQLLCDELVDEGMSFLNVILTKTTTEWCAKIYNRQDMIALGGDTCSMDQACQNAVDDYWERLGKDKLRDELLQDESVQKWIELNKNL